MTTSSTTTDARALASRRNGARSRGPKTAAGRVRAARNALKHGLCARTLVLLDDESSTAFGAFEAAVRAELAPAGALQADLVARIVVAAWRGRRADRLEAALLGRLLRVARAEGGMRDALGLQIIRDCNGPRALDTLLRYRGSVFVELLRSLGALKLLQAGDGSQPHPPATLPHGLPASSIVPATKRTREDTAKQ
jgi:hypothetical protein